jgi:hypothetical protein
MKTEKPKPDSQNPKVPMSGLSYSYSFQCKKCGEQMTVTRADARCADDGPDTHNALKAVLKERGWAQAFGGMFCPDYVGEDE